MGKKYFTLADWKTKGNFARSLAYQFYLQKYLNVWIPREEEYYNTFDFVSNANILI